MLNMLAASGETRVLCALAASYPSGDEAVVCARDLLSAACMGRIRFCDIGEFCGPAPLVIHMSESFEMDSSVTPVGGSLVTGISADACPFIGGSYCASSCRDYILSRADKCRFLRRLSGRKLLCDCSRDYCDCWAWILHSYFCY